ncbi:MAG: 50S ribosomal protein L11 methyltransferase [Vicinamibacterales bacterium]
MRTWPALLVGGADFSRPDDLVQAALLDFEVAAVEDTGDGPRVFFNSDDARAAAAQALGRQFPDLTCTPIDVPDEDWAARSQAGLRAIRIGKLVVAPPWDAGDIIIQPSMGFGTGHHATTRLCLAALQRIELRGRSVIDVGTGSGVLAIAASLLGASPVTGIDDDPDAVQAARENLGLNPKATVTFDVIDLRTSSLPPADVVLANLTGGLLIAAARMLMSLAVPGGRLVLSGFMDHEETAVVEAFRPSTVAQREQEDEWVCVTLESRP